MTRLCQLKVPLTVENGLAVVGGVYLGIKALQWATFLRSLYINGPNLKARYAKAGSWVVVSGGSEGIGLALATEFAKRGFHVMLIALDEPRLYDAANEIQRTFPGIQAIPVAFDFLAADDAAYDRLYAKIDEIEVAVLVNNVGGFYNYLKPFDVARIAEDLRLLHLNCEPQLRLTKHLLPRFKGRRCGAIINLSSFSAVVPAPYLTTYAGTKAFNLAFSRSLNDEVREFGIDLLAVTPCFVSTRITQGYEEKPMMVGDNGTVCAKQMAQHTINKLGVVTETCGHNLHDWIGATKGLWRTVGGGKFLEVVKTKYAEQAALEAADKKAA